MSPTPKATPISQIDPELTSALAALPKAPNGKLMDLNDIPALQAQTRAMSEAMAAQLPLPDGVALTDTHAPRADGSQLPLSLYRPATLTGAAPALLYFHPGGQVVGEGMRSDGPLGALALQLDAAIIAIDYRCAPQAQAPAMADDGYLAYTHVLANAGELSLDPERVGLVGISGGGSPAAATALMARDRGIPAPCLLALSYPMLDDTNTTPSSQQITDIGIWDREESLLAWQAILGERTGSPDLSPYCAPARATDLTQMPRTFIAVGQFDLVRDESIALATGLIAAGVPVDLHVYGRAFHSWDLFAPASRLAQEYTRTWQAFLRRELHG